MMSTMATSSTQTNYSSSYLAGPRTWNYDVFLSFRGEDTRRNFTDHLYDALTRAGIRTFRDDDQLPRGKHIPFQLMRAIEESRISIIVLSKNYASSRWCLNELVKVLECKNTRGQLVLPLFYSVDPSHVRKQTGKFAKAFERHEKEKGDSTSDINKWRAALTEVANLSGWDLQNVANRHESKFIKKIVDKVLGEVNQTYMNVAVRPVGIDYRVASVNSLLSFESNGVRIVGIYGMGGIGKSTIAKAVYNRSYLLFEGCSFIANVREVSKQPNGLVQIQEQILSETLKEKNFKVGNVDRGMVLMKERLCSKRVLIVLDDVDNLRQVNALAGQNDWFGPKSRIIITTRDEHLTSQAKGLWRYHVNKLDDKESLELFNLHAFKTTTPPDDYLELSKGIIAYFEGLPLALEVFGGHLVGRPREQWESAFKRLQQIPDNQIQEQLKISYYGLDCDVKRIFLHIACFFVGMENDLVRIILDDCGFFSENGIIMLKERCLLKVKGKNNELIMHNLVRDMGRAIVLEESPQKPGMRSRLWFHEDIDYVLQNDKGTEAIEGISLVLSTPKETKISSTSFARINNLQLLKMNNVHVTGSLEHLSNQLRWLCWHHYPLKCLQSIFHMEKLVVLDMRYSKIDTIWEGCKFLKSLKILNLSHSNFLKGTMDFNGVPMLETLLLEGCTRLLEVHSSIGVLDRLAHLNLKGCEELKNLPDSICMLSSLGYLNLIGCSNLGRLPENIGHLKNLTSLHIDGCNRSELVNYSRFSSVPSSFSLGRSPDSTRFLPNSISSLQSLTVLRARDCNLSDGDIPMEIGNLSSLKTLDFGQNNFCFLPDSLNLLSKLDQLAVDVCRNLKSLPELPPNIRVVSMDGCESIERLPNLSSNKKSIFFNLGTCRFVASNNMLKSNSVRRLRIDPRSNLVRNFIDNLSQVHTAHVGFPYRFIKKYVIPNVPSNGKDYYELKFLAVYEAKKDGRVEISIRGPSDSTNDYLPCFSCFESRNCGNYSIASRIPLGTTPLSDRRSKIYSGEYIRVVFEIAPSACIVVKMCQLQLFHSTRYMRGVSVEKILERKEVTTIPENEVSSRLIMEDEDQMINNRRDTEYIHLVDDAVANNFLIKIVDTAQVLKDVL